MSVSEMEEEQEGQEMEELEEEMVLVSSSMKDVPVATLVSTA